MSKGYYYIGLLLSPLSPLIPLVNDNSKVVDSIGVFHGPLKVTRDVAMNFEVRTRTAFARFVSVLTHL